MKHKCPQCGSDNLEECVKEIDIGTKIQSHKDLFCHNCGIQYDPEMVVWVRMKGGKDEI